MEIQIFSSPGADNLNLVLKTSQELRAKFVVHSSCMFCSMNLCFHILISTSNLDW